MISLLIQYANVSIESIDSTRLSLLALDTILLTSFANTLCFLLPNVSFDFSINLSFFMNLCNFL